MDAATLQTEVAAIEVEAASAASSAEVAADAATQALISAQILADEVEQRAQAAAVAVVEQVETTARETEWNTERLESMHREMTEIRAMVLPLQATMETLAASVALLVNSSAASLSSAPETPNPQSVDVDALPVLETPPIVAPVEAAPESPPPRKEKRHRML